jgi:DNA-binding transcriptional ArsR family regulator
MAPRNKSTAAAATGRFAYAGLDRVIHERARLSLLTSMVAHPSGLLFGELKQLCALTDGNLSRHLHVLEEAKLITANKSFDRHRPQTICRITSLGRERFLAYLSELENVVRDAATAAATHPIRGTIRKLAPA